ncbi:MAG: glycosyltransferase [Ktedonobacteraceae bacterium]
MRFLILTNDYTEFLAWLYAQPQHPGLKRRRYEEQMRARIESLFGGPYIYSNHLRELGHESQDIYFNNLYMQKAWARENGLKVKEDWRWKFRLRRGLVPWVSRVRGDRWFYDILAAQIKHHKPDVLLNLAMDRIKSHFLKEMKPYVRLLMGQHASPLPQGEDYSCYDLFTSSLPDLVDYFRQQGIAAEFHCLGFDPGCLSCVEADERPFDMTFIGSFHPSHSGRVALLEALCLRFPQIKIWAPSIAYLAPNSPIRACYEGPAWGRTMYRILARSKITLNNHGDFAPYANNGRLYEATGMGTLLMTDWKENLHELFEPGKEVVAYRSSHECAELVRYYLEHDNEREAIAHAGQERTLRAHTEYQRAQELLEIVHKYL